VRDVWAEQMFFAIYGSPAVQAMAGVEATGAQSTRKAGKSALYDELRQARIVELKSRIAVGGLREAVVRSLLYVGMARGSVDERGFEMVRRIRRDHGGLRALSISAFKALVREQYLMLLINREAALAAVPSLLPAEPETRLMALDLMRQVLSASRNIDGEVAQRMQRIDQLFGVDSVHAGIAPLVALTATPGAESRKAS
jgi:hypothetical protein